MPDTLPTAPGAARADMLIRTLRLQPHPEGGHYAERWRSPLRVTPHDRRPTRSALTTIDFLLRAGERSAWHRVASDEVWHLLEGDGLRLWLMPGDGGSPMLKNLGPVDEGGRGPTAVVPAGWWQAAEPVGAFAYCAATVGPGFEFADFAFLRDDSAALASLRRADPSLERLC